MLLVVLLGFSGLTLITFAPAHAAGSIVQEVAFGGHAFDGNVWGQSLGPTAAVVIGDVSSGDILILSMSGQISGGAFTSITDTQSNSWTECYANTNSNDYYQFMYYTVAGATGADTIALTAQVAYGASLSGVFVEVSGIGTTCTPAAGESGTGGNTQTQTFNYASSSFIIGGFVVFDTTHVFPYAADIGSCGSPQSGLTVAELPPDSYTGLNAPGCIGYALESSSGSTTFAISYSTSHEWESGGASFSTGAPSDIIASYSLSGGGSPPSAPTLLCSSPNHNYTLTTTPTALTCNSAATFTVGHNPLGSGGAVGTQRWYTTQSLTGTISGQTINWVFYNQYLETSSYAISCTAGKTCSQAPLFNYTQNGVAMHETSPSTSSGSPTVQQKTDGYSSNSDPVTGAFGSDPAIGDILAVYTQERSFATVTVSDTIGNSWTQVAYFETAGSSGGCPCAGLFTTTNKAHSADTISVSNGMSNGEAFEAYELSGVIQTPVNVASEYSGSSCPGSLTTSTSSSFTSKVQAIAGGSWSNNGSPTHGTDFTIYNNNDYVAGTWQQSGEYNSSAITSPTNYPISITGGGTACAWLGAIFGGPQGVWADASSTAYITPIINDTSGDPYSTTPTFWSITAANVVGNPSTYSAASTLEEITFAVSPSTVQNALTISGIHYKGSVTLPLASGAEISISAVSVALGPNLNALSFLSWSNGGSRVQTYTVPSAPTTVTASYGTGSSCGSNLQITNLQNLMDTGCEAGAFFGYWFDIFGPWALAIFEFLPALGVYMYTESPIAGVGVYVLLFVVFTAAVSVTVMPASLLSVGPGLLGLVLAGAVMQALRSNKGG